MDQVETAPAREPAASRPTAPATPMDARRNALLAAAEEREELHATPGFYRRSWRHFRRNKVAMTALVLLVFIGLFVLSAPLISRATGFTPYENHLPQKLMPPRTGGYLLGSDGNGRDILTRLAYGGRVSLMIAVLSTFATLALGGAIGLTSGYLGGK
ncbi:MAG: hypothetical protein IT337_18190, partial [Thermomicrobiales bacterium]|nr:hypothetical protein [Thermomicrobiales bacterium]